MIYYYSPSTISGGCLQYINYIQNGWVKKLSPNDAVFGEACHLYIAKRTQGMDEIDAMIEAANLFITKPKYIRIKYITSDSVKTFCGKWESRDKKYEYVKLPDGSPSCEFSLAYPVTEDAIATGTVDGFVKINNGCALFDVKTTSKKDPDLTVYEMSSQFLHYLAIIKAFSQSQPNGWIATELFPNLKQVIIASIQISYTGSIKIEYYPFAIDWNRVDTYWNLLTNLIRDTKGLTTKTGLLTNQCMSGKDYSCDLIELCKNNNTTDYEQRIYNPISRHKGSKLG